jgi:hypothetical protein
MADSAGAKELWTHRYSSRGIKNTIHRPNATRRQYLYIVDFVNVVQTVRHLFYLYQSVRDFLCSKRPAGRSPEDPWIS